MSHLPEDRLRPIHQLVVLETHIESKGITKRALNFFPDIGRSSNGNCLSKPKSGFSTRYAISAKAESQKIISEFKSCVCVCVCVCVRGFYRGCSQNACWLATDWTWHTANVQPGPFCRSQIRTRTLRVDIPLCDFVTCFCVQLRGG